MQHPYHCFFFDSKDRALGHRGRRGHAKRLSGQASFTEKIPASQDCDDRFLPARGEDRQLHLTPLNVKHRVRRTALDEDGVFLPVLLDGLSPTDFRKVHPGVEWRGFFLYHESPLHSDRDSHGPIGWSPYSSNLAQRL